MSNLLKYDFYKLIRSKSFYICAAISLVISTLTVFLCATGYNEIGYNMFKPYDSLMGISDGLSSVTLLITIAIVIFIPSDFSFGTIKNMISAGASRINIYLSKLIVSCAIIFSYMVVNIICCGIVGACMGEVGEYTRDTYLTLLKMFGYSFLAQLALASLCVMISFLIRKKSVVITVAILLNTIGTSFLASIIDFCVKRVTSIEDFSSIKYFPLSYVGVGMGIDSMPKNDLITSLIVFGVYVVLCTVVGMIVFKKVDIE
ncbi:MAG: ABC transporter permease [Acutalibacteraceae bacterium]